MSKRAILSEIVNELTEIADVIRSQRGSKKVTTNVDETKGKYSQWFYWSHEYRLRHIAYSELKGKSREQIENPKRKELKPWDEQAIVNHKERYEQLVQTYKLSHPEKYPQVEVSDE